LSGPRGRTPDETADTRGAADPWAHTAPVYDGPPVYADEPTYQPGYRGAPDDGYDDYGPPGEAPTGRKMSPIAIAGMIAAVLISLGLIFALLSPALTGKRTGNGSPNLPGVLDPTPAGTAAPQVAAPEVPTDSASPTESPSASASASASATAATGNVAVENAVVALVNAERKKAKCDPVRVDGRLRTAARRHSTDMATRNFLSHQGSDGSSADDRMRQAGFDDPLSEDVARGFTSAKDVVRAWLRSGRDRKNIDDCDATAVGVGVAVGADGTPYWTQDFGQ
jgi:uncharacterized protein YkwD